MSSMTAILVGTDGSVGAVAAMDWAADLAQATGAALHAVHCVPGHHDDNGDRAAAQALTLWSASATRSGVDVTESLVAAELSAMSLPSCLATAAVRSWWCPMASPPAVALVSGER